MKIHKLIALKFLIKNDINPLCVDWTHVSLILYVPVMFQGTMLWFTKAFVTKNRVSFKPKIIIKKRKVQYGRIKPKLM